MATTPLDRWSRGFTGSSSTRRATGCASVAGCLSCSPASTKACLRRRPSQYWGCHPGELLDAVRTLRPAYRMVIALRYVLDYTPSEIANVLDIPAATARTHLRRALDELRGSIDREEATDALAP